MAIPKPLPFIPRKYINVANGTVDLWDTQIEGGPVKITFTGILAREALDRDPERYAFELPRGTKPGPLQIEIEERAEAERLELEAMQQNDPMHRMNQ